MSEESQEPKPSFFGELKRRKVIRVAGVYVVVAWLMLQAGEILFPAFEIPDWGLRMMAILAVLGFPIAIVLAWAFEVTPEGVKVTKSVNTTVPADQVTPDLGKKKTLAVFLLGAGVPTVGFGLLFGFLIMRGGLGSPGDIGEKSIAVLPFENMSTDEDNAYFTRGIHEDILTRLSNVEDFRVISRTSVLQYENSPKNIRDIARDLGVNYIVEGSVRRVGDRVRVTAQLIQADSDEHMWASNVDTEIEDVFEVQLQISQNIVDALKAELSPEEAEQIARIPTQVPAAYDLYLKARDVTFRSALSAVEGYREAEGLFKAALQLDPQFADAWVELSLLYSRMVWFNVGDTRDLKQLSRDALDQAREINRAFHKVSIAEGFYAYYILEDYPQALVHFNIAVEQAPNDGDAIFSKAVILRRLGKWDESLSLIRRATQLDPLNTAYLYTLCTSLAALKDYETMWETIQKLERLNGRLPDLLPHRATYFTDFEGDVEKALDYILTQEVNRSSPIFFMNAAGLFSDTRKFEEGIRFLSQSPPDLNFGPKYSFARDAFLAQLYHYKGNQEKARELSLATLEKSRSIRNEPSFHFTQGDEDNYLVWEAYTQSILGNAEEAVKAIKKVTFRVPVERDAVDGASNLEHLARVYSRVGDAENAVPVIQRLMIIPSGLSWMDLQISPDFDPIRDHPDFQQVVAQFKPGHF